MRQSASESRIAWEAATHVPVAASLFGAALPFAQGRLERTVPKKEIVLTAIPKTTKRQPGGETWQAGFLRMLPRIKRQASLAFRGLPQDTREDLIEEVVINGLVAYKRLYDKGKIDLAYPSVLALNGIRQVREGRKTGCRLNVKDVSSDYCQLKQRLTVERLDRFDNYEGIWTETVVEGRHTPVAEQVCFRIDFPNWSSHLSVRDRQIAEALAAGSRPGEVAEQFDIVPSRISQLCRMFANSWRAFHGTQETDD